jgi:hypothetical protein
VRGIDAFVLDIKPLCELETITYPLSGNVRLDENDNRGVSLGLSYTAGMTALSH